ncbi:MAG: YkgJ family cysteine cluster protein [Polyangiaceae bacterium]|nr:YkgJ family cysteine cluster protein [Polyangiaceae bacterium]
MSTPTLPFRPRLADHAMPRRHTMDGVEVVVVHDARTGDLLRMPPRAWELMEAADGTRDLDGLLLAASQKGQLYQSSEVVSVLTDLMAAGLLTDGIDPFALEEAESVCDPETALEVLPFLLVCDGSGACCSAYNTIRFSNQEAERARALLPMLSDGYAKRFMPLAGSGAQKSCAAPMVNGGCSYLSESGKCEIHRVFGMAAKPAGCAVYPATFVYDGEVVRVSLGVECACVAKSIASKIGEPLVPAGATLRGDLPKDVQIGVVPNTIVLAEGLTCSREEFLRWSKVVTSTLRRWAPLEGSDLPVWSMAFSHDVVSICWQLSTTVADSNFVGGEKVRAIQPDVPPSHAEVLPWIAALANRMTAKHESAVRWRSEHDNVRATISVLTKAAKSLLDEDVLALVLAGEGANRKVESFYLTAAIHGHQLVGDVPVSLALRDRAIRILLSRAVCLLPRENELPESLATYPLPAVESVMRAQGGKEYLRDLQK